MDGMNRYRYVAHFGLIALATVLATVLGAVLGIGCGAGAGGHDGVVRTADGAVVGVQYDQETGDPVGLERHRRWSDRVGQGAQPHGDVAFENLAALGYTTVLSVDGAVPAVDAAKKHGLRYVHIPIGYDGVPDDAAARIIAAVERSAGPVYIHCHHGRHRGPAAAMVARITVDKISNDDAVASMKLSGTSPKYEGLYRDIAQFVGVSAAAKNAVPATLPSTVLPKGIQANMVGVDRSYTYLTQSRANDWKGVPDSPDVSTPHEARMLWEHFRELRREPKAKAHGASFIGFAKDSEKSAIALEKALRANNEAATELAFSQVKNSCNACHKQFRN